MIDARRQHQRRPVLGLLASGLRREVDPDQGAALGQVAHSSSSPDGGASTSSRTSGSSSGRIAATSSSSAGVRPLGPDHQGLALDHEVDRFALAHLQTRHGGLRQPDRETVAPSGHPRSHHPRSFDLQCRPYPNMTQCWRPSVGAGLPSRLLIGYSRLMAADEQATHAVPAVPSKRHGSPIPTGRHGLHVPIGKRCHEQPLGPLRAREQLGREQAVAGLPAPAAPACRCGR